MRVCGIGFSQTWGALHFPGGRRIVYQFSHGKWVFATLSHACLLNLFFLYFLILRNRYRNFGRGGGGQGPRKGRFLGIFKLEKSLGVKPPNPHGSATDPHTVVRNIKRLNQTLRAIAGLFFFKKMGVRFHIRI